MARAERLLQIKRYAEAEAIYQDFLFNNPRDPDGLLGLSRCRHGQGDDEGAQRYLRQLLDVDPDSVRALVALGHLALERGDYRAADQAYGRALAINSNAVEAMYGQARVREQAGDVGEALRLLHRIAELAPETELAAQAYRRVAEIQAGLNRF
jgi:tetratricopeptide (TPR) repeat protein